MGKKEKRKDEAAATYDEFIAKVREGISSHGKEFLLQIHEKLNTFDELYNEEEEDQQEEDQEEEVQPAEEEEEKEALQSDFEDLDDIAKTRQVIEDNNDAEMIDAGQEQPPKAQPESDFIKVIRIKRKRKPTAMSTEQLEAKKPTPSTPPPTPTPSAAVVPTTSSAPATQMDSAAATTQKTRTATTMEGTSREKLMPPIVCFKLNVAELNRHLRGLCVAYKATNYNNGKTVILTKTKDNHRKITEYLKERKTEFNTYTPKEDKKVLMMLKGVHSTFEVKDIIEELKHEGINAVNVSPQKGRKDKEYNNFVVELEKDCDIPAVFKKTLLLNQKIHWEKFRTTTITQCKNCQAFGHVASNCGMRYRCVKCKDQHLPGECPRTKNNTKDDNVYCVNCQKTGHPASWKGCPVLKRKMEERRKAAEKKVEQAKAVKKTTVESIQQGLSFATVAARATQRRQPTKTTKPQETSQQAPAATTTKKQPAPAPKPATKTQDKGDVFADAERLFGADLFTLVQKAKQIVPSNYASLDDKAKTLIIGRLICQLCI